MKKSMPWLRALLALLVIFLPAILITLGWGWDSPLYQVQHNLMKLGSLAAVIAVVSSFLAGFWFARSYDS